MRRGTIHARRRAEGFLPPPTTISGEKLAALFDISQDELMEICGIGFREELGLYWSVKYARMIAERVGVKDPGRKG